MPGQTKKQSESRQTLPVGVKIGIPAKGPNLEDRVGDRLGLSPYLHVFDLDAATHDVHEIPMGESGRGTGFKMVALAVENKIDVILADQCGATAEKYFLAQGVKIITDITGPVGEVLDAFIRQEEHQQGLQSENHAPIAWQIDQKHLKEAIQGAFNQIKNMLPVLLGVIFLVGLFNTFVSESVLASFLSGNPWWDALWSAAFGSVCAGNPINSYIIGGKLLEMGVSISAVTAFLCAWVTVGIVQLPAESAALGWKFALVRNLVCFFLSVLIAFAMVVIF